MININPLAPIFSIGEKLIDKLIPDPAAKAKATQDLLILQQQGELKELETRMTAILAEANSTDPWTSRARPSFMYLFYFLLLMLVIVAPFVGVFYPAEMQQFYVNVKAGFNAIPEALWWTFSTGYLGYSTLRTREKEKGVTK
jgi:hypothetical protein